MESICGKGCQDPIPAMLTLNQAEMQGSDQMDPAQGTGAKPAVVGTARAASPAWSFVGSHLPNSPELMGTSVPSCVTSPQPCSSAMPVALIKLWQESEKE